MKPKDVVEWVFEQTAVFALKKWILQRLGPDQKAFLRKKLRRAPEPLPPGGKPCAAGASVHSRAQWVVQNTVRRLPTTKLHREFGPLDLVSLDEALDTTAAWLEFAGFAAPKVVLSQAPGVSLV